jgi:dTDP-4-amino-4,6-dideoxygalactose transaminase
MIPFNKPYVNKVLSFDASKISGDGYYSNKVKTWFIERLRCDSFHLTTSCTDALEMCSLLLDISPGDEVISPSFTFVSTVNSFVLRGAKIVFVDIDPMTMNIDENLIEDAINNKTKAIIIVHYAGVSCNMDSIIKIADKYKIPVIEDAAQGVMSKYKNKYLGTIGELGTYSFHETKNYTMGEGGALVINKKKYFERAEIIREKGTNRSNFLRGQVDKYTWVDLGSSFLPSDILAAYLYPQLEIADAILNDRLSSWKLYYSELQELTNHIDLPYIPEYAHHNAHMFYIKTKNIEERTSLINQLSKDGIQAVFHYVPLHSSPAGIKYGRFHGVDRYTTKESERLLRLPLYYQMDKTDIIRVCESIKRFYC